MSLLEKWKKKKFNLEEWMEELVPVKTVESDLRKAIDDLTEEVEFEGGVWYIVLAEELKQKIFGSDGEDKNDTREE